MHISNPLVMDSKPTTEFKAPKLESLPLKFSFGKQPSPPPEKSDREKEVDALFAEYDDAMAVESGSTIFQVEPIDSVPPHTEVTQHILCSQGKHDLILDEEIGIICKFCVHVQLEIKYVVPDFAPNPYGKADNDSDDYLDDLGCNDSDDSGSNSRAHGEGKTKRKKKAGMVGKYGTRYGASPRKKIKN